MNYKPAIYFLLRYLALYLVLNTVYAFYIDHYQEEDPLTLAITQQTAAFLRLVGEPVSAVPVPGSINVPLVRKGVTVIEVYEGCNSVNVIIVYLCFLIAFRGAWRTLLKFAGAGILIIYVMNVLRLAALYGIAFYHPQQLYFFHKFFFTGILYAVVFVLWYYWIKNFGRWNTVKA